MSKAKKILSTMKKGKSKVEDVSFDAGLASTKFVGNRFVKKVDKNIYNGYTGLKTTGLATVAAFGAAAVWGKTTAPIVGDQRLMESVQTDYIGKAPHQNYDGVGNAPTLGATGNMVFGLHNSRKG